MILQVEGTNIFPSSSFLSVLSLVLLWLRSLSGVTSCHQEVTPERLL